MIGAIIGDIIGSRFEGIMDVKPNFKLFTDKSVFTDDTVMTVATMYAIMNKVDYGIAYHKFGNAFPQKGYGKGFIEWLKSEDPQPYDSWGNGSAMRVSPISYAFNTMKEVLSEAKKSAKVTHNHEEGIKGAQAIALTIYLARKNYSKQEIKEQILKKFNYNLKIGYGEIEKKFDCSCQGTVPPSLLCFFESIKFEDAIRKAVMLGGDTDTLACMTGAIAEAFYGVPFDLTVKIMKILPQRLKTPVLSFYQKYIFGVK